MQISPVHPSEGFGATGASSTGDADLWCWNCQELLTKLEEVSSHYDLFAKQKTSMYYHNNLIRYIISSRMVFASLSRMSKHL